MIVIVMNKVYGQTDSLYLLFISMQDKSIYIFIYFILINIYSIYSRRKRMLRGKGAHLSVWYLEFS